MPYHAILAWTCVIALGKGLTRVDVIDPQGAVLAAFKTIAAGGDLGLPAAGFMAILPKRDWTSGRFA